MTITVPERFDHANDARLKKQLTGSGIAVTLIFRAQHAFRISGVELATPRIQSNLARAVRSGGPLDARCAGAIARRSVDATDMVGMVTRVATHPWRRCPFTPRNAIASRRYTRPGVVDCAEPSAAQNLPLAARGRVGHIGLVGDVAEWLKAAVC
jgi:hypothetical protein